MFPMVFPQGSLAFPNDPCSSLCELHLNTEYRDRGETFNLNQQVNILRHSDIGIIGIFIPFSTVWHFSPHWNHLGNSWPPHFQELCRHRLLHRHPRQNCRQYSQPRQWRVVISWKNFSLVFDLELHILFHSSERYYWSDYKGNILYLHFALLK